MNTSGTITSSTDPGFSNGSGSLQSNGTASINMPSGTIAILSGTMASDKKSISGNFTVNGSNAGTWSWTKS